MRVIIGSITLFWNLRVFFDKEDNGNGNDNKRRIEMPPSLSVAAAEISYWALVGAILPLGIVIFRSNTHNSRVGLMGAAFIPLMFAPVSALCGAAACWFVGSQDHRLILAPLANLAASVLMFW